MRICPFERENRGEFTEGLCAETADFIFVYMKTSRPGFRADPGNGRAAMGEDALKTLKFAAKKCKATAYFTTRIEWALLQVSSTSKTIIK